MSTSVAAALQTGAIHTPNDALQRDAGPLARAVAQVLARPHAAYFESEPGRRRLIAYVAKRCGLGPSAADAVSTWSMRRLAAHYTPGLPDGFLEALKRADGVWTFAHYAILEQILEAGGEGAKTLRHVARIDPMALTALLALPAGLRRGKILALTPSPYHADLIARAVKHGWGAHPDPAVVRRLVQRLERAASTAGLFGWLVEEIGVGRITPPPIPGTKWLRPIVDITDITRTALKFENCLHTRTPLMLRGRAAYFEVLGEEPAVVEVLAAVGGYWGIGEIRGHANTAVSQPLLARIRAHMLAHGAVRAVNPSQLALELAEAAGW